MEARFGRIPNNYSPPIDCDVNTLLGALDVDMSKEIAAANALQGTDKETALRRNFLAALVRIYQWRMLLLATEPRTLQAPWLACWPTLVNCTTKLPNSPGPTVKRPRFAALDLYVGSVYLDGLFGPGKPVPPKFPADQFDLPVLQVADSSAQELLVKAKPGYKLYNLSSAVVPAAAANAGLAWSACMFYDFAPGPTVNPAPATDMPHLIKFTKVHAKDAAAVFGDKVVLLPLEKISRTDGWGETKVRTRCVIVKDFLSCGPRMFATSLPSAGALTAFLGKASVKMIGTFVGVGDFEDLDEKNRTIDLAGDLGLF